MCRAAAWVTRLLHGAAAGPRTLPAPLGLKVYIPAGSVSGSMGSIIGAHTNGG